MSAPPGLAFSRRDVLRWQYLGRLVLVTGIMAGALWAWGEAGLDQTFWATVMFLAAFALTAPAAWHTQIRGAEPGDTFVYGQVIFDALLVTGTIHITGGGDSPFIPLYILVISVGALLLPLPGGVLAGVLAAILLFAEIVLLLAEPLDLNLMLQVSLFGTVAVITGLVGDRVRRARLALGAVESELRQLRLDTGDILASISTGVLTVDGQGRLMYLNPAGQALLGLESKQWEGADVISAVEAATPGLGSLLRRTMGDGVPLQRFKTVVRRASDEITLGISTTVLEREDGGPPSVTAIFQDITDQERLDAMNRRTERLEAIAKLSASLAHEIKNPLASIRSSVEQLTGSVLGEDDRGALQRLVVTESDRLDRLLSEFLEFSALRLGQPERVDFAALIQDCVTLLRQHPDAMDGVEIQCVGVESPMLIAGDVDLLHRAVFNLVLNAIQFSGSEGSVTVTLEGGVPAPAFREGGMPDPIRLTVSDSGPGIDPDQIPRIFDPFYTTRSGGTGLGLAVVHRAVEAHSGAVFVDRGEDGGARFVLYLPGTSADETTKEG